MPLRRSEGQERRKDQRNGRTAFVEPTRQALEGSWLLNAVSTGERPLVGGRKHHAGVESKVTQQCSDEQRWQSGNGRCRDQSTHDRRAETTPEPSRGRAGRRGSWREYG